MWITRFVEHLRSSDTEAPGIEASKLLIWSLIANQQKPTETAAVRWQGEDKTGIPVPVRLGRVIVY